MTYLYKAISAAWRTGYANRPSLRSASEMAVSSAAFLDTANFDYMSVYHRQSMRYIPSKWSSVVICQLD
jgi:hypothetical protein